MNDERPWKKLRILDFSEVRGHQMIVSFISVIVYSIYTVLLYLFCQLSAGIILAATSLVTQIAVGTLCGWAYQILGANSKSRVTLLNSSNLDATWSQTQLTTNMSELAAIFENFTHQVQKLENGLDDILDITWFVVIVWAAITATLIVVVGSNPFICLSPSIILIGLSFAAYYVGYRSGNPLHLDEPISHLEYLAKSRIVNLQSALESNNSELFMQWRMKNGTWVLADIGVHFKKAVVGAFEHSLDYYIGLKPDSPEHFILQLSPETESHAIQILKLPIVLDLKWDVQIEHSPREVRARITNTGLNLDISKPISFIQSPSIIESTSEKLTKSVELILTSQLYAG